MSFKSLKSFRKFEKRFLMLKESRLNFLFRLSSEASVKILYKTVLRFVAKNHPEKWVIKSKLADIMPQ